MLLLALIALAQLALLVLILAAVVDRPQVPSAELSPAQRIRSLEHQTIDALLRVSDEAQAKDDWSGHYYHPGQ